MSTPRAIIGAGLAGLIAAHAFPGVPVLETAPRGTTPHRAVLRFRSDAVSRLTGIPFRAVRVHKGIWSRGAYVAPNPQLANLYARKCLDRALGDRSIWNLAPADRWVAPESFPEQMLEAVGERVQVGTGFDFAGWGARAKSPGECVISTAPLSAALAALGLAPTMMPELLRAPIWTRRYRVECADAHQTVYFPDHHLATYRASLTGDLLIVEARSNLGPAQHEDELEDVALALGLNHATISPIDSGEQRFGKIVALQDDERRAWMARLTIDASIYSLGRFATWRNVLLDDVVRDAEVIRRMLRAPPAATNFLALRHAAGR